MIPQRPHPLSEWASRLEAEYRRGRPLALLFDYDRTLTPIVRHPSLARLPAHTRRMLARLATLPRVSVGVITGRALGEAREFVGLADLFYAGSGGTELDLGQGRLEYPEAAAFRTVLDGLQDRLVEILQRYPGTWAERKPVALSLHFRGLPPLMAMNFRFEATGVTRDLASVRTRVVSQAIEITPANGWDKGTAVSAILDRLGPDTMPIYFGDAANDEEAMLVAEARGGITVGIGEDAPAQAQLRLRSSEELAGQLRALLVALTGEEMADDGSPVSTAPVPDFTLDPTGLIQTSSIATEHAPGLLVIDADRNVRSTLLAEMAARGWNVWAVDDPAKAAPLLERPKSDIHAVLVDMQFPGLQGARTLSALSAIRPSVVRCLTADEVTPFLENAYHQITDTPLFPKPLDLDRLNAELRRLIGPQFVAR